MYSRGEVGGVGLALRLSIHRNATVLLLKTKFVAHACDWETPISFNQIWVDELIVLHYHQSSLLQCNEIFQRGRKRIRCNVNVTPVKLQPLLFCLPSQKYAAIYLQEAIEIYLLKTSGGYTIVVKHGYRFFD